MKVVLDTNVLVSGYLNPYGPPGSILGLAEPVTAVPLPQRLPDYSDEPFLEAALGGRAECLVTGNRKHFPARLCLGMRVISPVELVDGFRGRPGAGS